MIIKTVAGVLESSTFNYKRNASMKLFRLLLVGLVLTSAISTCFATTLFPQNVKCAVCGHESKQEVIGSTNSSGTRDLDLRPPEMARSTMPYWVQRCPECGYCNDSLDEKTSVDKEYLSSKEYKALFADIQEDSLAASFIRQARIAEKDKSYENAMYAYLSAAWCCDDARNSEGAKQCRLLALKLLDANFKDIVKSSDEDTITCLKTDMLRRAGKFEEAQAVAEKQLPKVKQHIIKQILTFEIEKSKAKDAKVYRVAEAATEDADEESEDEESEVVEDAEVIEEDFDEP